MSRKGSTHREKVKNSQKTRQFGWTENGIGLVQGLGFRHLCNGYVRSKLYSGSGLTVEQ